MNEELYHHGIKGMRWGVRRYQNADGSYTSAGKARYRTDSSMSPKARKAVINDAVKASKIKKADASKAKPASEMTDDELRRANARYKLEKKYNDYTAPKDKFKERIEASKSVANDVSNIANRSRELADRTANRQNKQRPMKPMDLSHMTDQELRDRINRGNLERQYTQMYGTPQAARGREKVAAVLDYAGTVLAIGGSAASIALTIYEINKAR